MNDEQIKAHEEREFKTLRQRVKVLEAQNVLLESLLYEGLRHGYLDLDKCPPTWIAEAQRATTR